MNKQLAAAMREFLSRADLKGGEAQAMVACQNYLAEVLNAPDEPQNVEIPEEKENAKS